MYIRNVEIENAGPIKYFHFDFPFSQDGQPLPVLLVGQNGAGKSILLSYIVNALINAKGAVYSDSEVQQGKVYKLRSPAYVKQGETFARGHVRFENGFFQGEIQSVYTKKDFEDSLMYTPADPLWSQMADSESSKFSSNFDARRDELEGHLAKFSHLYFPANRFEEPAWLNAENLANITSYSSKRRIIGVSGRRIIHEANMKDNQSWLLDVLYDRFAIERRFQSITENDENFDVKVETNGPSTKLLSAIETFLKRLFREEGSVQWGVGKRGHRSITFDLGENRSVTNLYSLSTGQTSLLNMFLSIVRDYDLSDARFESLDTIRGTVVVDEIDLHLHTEQQHSILPDLIALFPRVQFVITTHSPLFILGLEKRLGTGGFSLIELPTGAEIGVERFSEFEAAYVHFRETSAFQGDMISAVKDSQSTLLIAEGTIDIDYINRAAELLDRQPSLQDFTIIDANGFGGLDKIWKHFDSAVAKVSNQKVVLLYDCDVAKPSATKAGVSRITLPQQPNRIAKGIENLFSDEFIALAAEANPAFIDVTPAFERSVRAAKVNEPEKWEINPDEKRNLADWIISNGTAKDFSGFSTLFDLLDDAKP